MKRILRLSALTGCIAAAVWMALLAPTAHNLAYAQQTLMGNHTVVYYNGYGQGYYGGTVPNYGGTYVFVPNNGYSGYGSGPYGNYPGYGNLGFSSPFGDRMLGGSAYRASRTSVYYRGY
jgi:hypothetical protein